jgi:DNA-binding CsgD family transcriptional regulator
MTLGRLRSVRASSSVDDLALAWIDHDVRARLIVDHRLLILWANATARASLARRQDLETRGGVLSTTQPAGQFALLDFIVDSGAGVSSIALPRPSGDGHLLVRAQRVCWEGYGRFGISFVGTGNDFTARYGSLDEAFRLTPSEHEVLLALLDGHDVDKVAENRRVSVETIRSQVRQIYAKLEVKTREGLFRRALPFLI